MATNEAGLWEWLRDVVLPIGHYSRIESPETAPGFPDVDYIIEGHAGKIELKHSRGRTKIPFSNEKDGIHLSQKIWIREAVANGTTVWIFAEVTPILYIIPGKNVAKINSASQRELWNLSEAIAQIDAPKECADLLKELLCP